MKNVVNSKNKAILNGALVLTVSTLIVKVFGLIYKVPLSYILSDEGMGYFNTAYTVYAFFYVISTAGVPKAISIITASEDDVESERVAKIAFRSFFMIGITLSLFLIAFSGALARLFGSNSSYLSMISIAPSVAFVAAGGALRGYFNGTLKLIPIAISEVISGVFKLIFGLVFAIIGQKLNFELYEIAAFSIFGITLASFLGFLYLYLIMKLNSQRNKKALTINFHSGIKTIRSILNISLPLFQVTATMRPSSDT